MLTSAKAKEMVNKCRVFGSSQNAGPGPGSGSRCLFLFQILSFNSPVLLFSSDRHLSFIYGKQKK